MTLRLAFLATAPFAVPTLDAILAAGYRIVRVYTAPPRPAGRGQRLHPSPVEVRASACGLPVHCPTRLGAPLVADFAALNLDLAVAIAYGKLLPPAMLAAPRLGCLNLHASLLPRWRGAAPIARAIMAGDRETGVSAMHMDAGLDSGPVYGTRRVAIGPRTTAGELHDALALTAAELALAVLAGLATGPLAAEPQPTEGVTYAAKLTPREEAIDWRRPAADLDRQIRALSPRPGAWFSAAGERVRVYLAEPAAGEPAPHGTILEGPPVTIACGEGTLCLVRLQRPGRGVLDAAAFVRGFPMRAGAQLDIVADPAA
ncbi:MAG: methionyl-tRNA formyltransferase [Alphaproteobacteria bacterium]|nr:methionyl-tRNA formyltransferase [Alphaproteobacteria bacterium]